jgi:hypothetical protein
MKKTLCVLALYCVNVQKSLPYYPSRQILNISYPPQTRKAGILSGEKPVFPTEGLKKVGVSTIRL